MSAAVAAGHFGGAAGWRGPLAAGVVEDPRPTVLVTTVDIGEGRTGRIELREGDEPVQAAIAFCQQYGLPESIVEPLALHIQDNMDRASEMGTEEVRRQL